MTIINNDDTSLYLVFIVMMMMTVMIKTEDEGDYGIYCDDDDGN